MARDAAYVHNSLTASELAQAAMADLKASIDSCIGYRSELATHMYV